MTDPRPRDPRWVAQRLVDETLRRGSTCRLWLTWEGGGPGWWIQPGRPSGRPARSYIEVAELEVDAAHKASDATTGWWAFGHLVSRVEKALTEGGS